MNNFIKFNNDEKNEYFNKAAYIIKLNDAVLQEFESNFNNLNDR